jgi:nicotinate-nucleotide--dimethylbenzimidazole phosphoribosyltransferase
METLKQYLENIKPIDAHAMHTAKGFWDTIAKPLNSLGELEKLVCKMAGITGNPQVEISKSCVAVMCADNGIVEEGVTQTDNSITYLVAKNMSMGTANVNLMARASHSDVFVVDIGMATPLENGLNIIDKKVSLGTKNFLKSQAMTGEQVNQAILVGIETVRNLKAKGYNIIATGEMGIGNTTTSSAIASVLLGVSPKVVTGKGAGLSEDGLQHKVEVIEKAIEMHHPDPHDPLDVLAKVGGYDICGMVGLYLGGAVYGVPIIIDGLISAVSALVACRLSKESVGYMLPSHMSKEPATTLIMKELGLDPIIHANMCLGEGTGSVALIPILNMALEVYHSNRTFNSIGMEAYKPL